MILAIDLRSYGLGTSQARAQYSESGACSSIISENGYYEYDVLQHTKCKHS